MAAKASRLAKLVLVGPELDSDVGLQFSVHLLPGSFKVDWCTVFPDRAGLWPQVKIVAVIQRSDADLVDWGEHAESEKNRLLRRFLFWSERVAHHLRSQSDDGAWIDAIEPCSGWPLNGARGQRPHNDVDAIERVLLTHVETVDRCRVLSHSTWRTSCYPTVMYTTADVAPLTAALRAATTDLKNAPAEKFNVE